MAAATEGKAAVAGVCALGVYRTNDIVNYKNRIGMDQIIKALPYIAGFIPGIAIGIAIGYLLRKALYEILYDRYNNRTP